MVTTSEELFGRNESMKVTSTATPNFKCPRFRPATLLENKVNDHILVELPRDSQGESLVLSVICNSFFDHQFQSFWKPTLLHAVKPAKVVTKNYRKMRERLKVRLKPNFVSDMAHERFGFFMTEDYSILRRICRDGFSNECNLRTWCLLGNPEKGLHISRHADMAIQNMINPTDSHEVMYMIIVKYFLGRSKITPPDIPHCKRSNQEKNSSNMSSENITNNSHEIDQNITKLPNSEHAHSNITSFVPDKFPSIAGHSLKSQFAYSLVFLCTPKDYDERIISDSSDPFENYLAESWSNYPMNAIPYAVVTLTQSWKIPRSPFVSAAQQVLDNELARIEGRGSGVTQSHFFAESDNYSDDWTDSSSDSDCGIYITDDDDTSFTIPHNQRNDNSENRVTKLKTYEETKGCPWIDDEIRQLMIERDVYDSLEDPGFKHDYEVADDRINDLIASRQLEFVASLTDHPATDYLKKIMLSVSPEKYTDILGVFFNFLPSPRDHGEWRRLRRANLMKSLHYKLKRKSTTEIIAELKKIPCVASIDVPRSLSPLSIEILAKEAKQFKKEEAEQLAKQKAVMKNNLFLDKSYMPPRPIFIESPGVLPQDDKAIVKNEPILTYFDKNNCSINIKNDDDVVNDDNHYLEFIEDNTTDDSVGETDAVEFNDDCSFGYSGTTGDVDNENSLSPCLNFSHSPRIVDWHSGFIIRFVRKLQKLVLGGDSYVKSLPVDENCIPSRNNDIPSKSSNKRKNGQAENNISRNDVTTSVDIVSDVNNSLTNSSLMQLKMNYEDEDDGSTNDLDSGMNKRAKVESLKTAKKNLIEDKSFMKSVVTELPIDDESDDCCMDDRMSCFESDKRSKKTVKKSIQPPLMSVAEFRSFSHSISRVGELWPPWCPYSYECRNFMPSSSSLVSEKKMTAPFNVAYFIKMIILHERRCKRVNDECFGKYLEGKQCSDQS